MSDEQFWVGLFKELYVCIDAQHFSIKIIFCTFNKKKKISACTCKTSAIFFSVVLYIVCHIDYFQVSRLIFDWQ